MSEKKKKGNKLKIEELTSVDLCRRGANPDADICLFKSAEGDPVPNNQPTTEERSLLGKMYDLLKGAFEPIAATPVTLEKDAKTFGGVRATEEVSENLWRYTNALHTSIRSIVDDSELDSTEKNTMLNESLEQFSEAMKKIFPTLSGISKADDDEGEKIDKSHKGDDEPVKIENIDKSGLTAEEQTQLDALLAKCTVADPTPAEPAAPAVPVVPATTTPATVPVVEKAAEPETDPAITKALEELATLKKSYEDMMEAQAKAAMLEVAKRYIPLGRKPEELADTLYSLKKSGDENYNAFVSALDANLEMVNKSGLFHEIGKSTHGASSSGGAYQKAEEIAKGLMKDDPALSYNAAMVKAWESNPALVAEYEAE